MKTSIRFSYTQQVVPPRCRKPRDVRFDDGLLSVTIREVTAEQAPIAIISKPTCEADGEIEVAYRWYGGQLWTSVHLDGGRPRGLTAREKDWDYQSIPEEVDVRSDSYGHGENYGLGLKYRAHGSRDEVVAAIRTWSKGHLVVDGVFYRPAAEPRYVVMTFGLGGNHGGTAVMVTDWFNPNVSRQAYFSLMEKDAALERGAQVATDRSDTRSLPMKLSTPDFQILLPEAIRVGLRKRKAVSR